MLLVNLYASDPDVFKSVDFRAGVNLIVAEIRVPENRRLDTHNLGKSTLGQLLDFTLLKGKDKNFFLFAYPDRFEALAFYLQVQLDDGDYLTIARPVSPGSKISFVRTSQIIDARDLAPEEWDAHGVSFDRAKTLLDGYLNMSALKAWGFRKLSGYLLRSQQDYGQVFQLNKFSGKHIQWKPFVAELVGLSPETALTLYQAREDLASSSARLETLRAEWPDGAASVSVLDGLIASKRGDVERIEATLERVDFAERDSEASLEVSEELDAQIAFLNERRYELQQAEVRITESLREERVFFRTNEAKQLFEEAGAHLGSSLVKSFDQLIAFNRAISIERREALETQQAEALREISEIDQQLLSLSERRAESLAYLRESEAVRKYRTLAQDLIDERADLLHLESRREAAERLVQLEREERQLAESLGHAIDRTEEDIANVSSSEDSRFARIRKYFDEILMTVLGHHAVLAMDLNREGGIEFTAGFVGPDGMTTSEDQGTSYKKLMCIAFDLALLRANLDREFPRFVFHDGAFEGLEKRPREHLMRVFRSYADYGLQPIITALDSDLDFEDHQAHVGETIRVLHDEGLDGRLFNCPPW